MYLSSLLTNQADCMRYIRLAAVAMMVSGPLAGQELVSFGTTDGGVVYANEYGTGGHVVILAHGGRFTKESWSRQAEALADSGYHVIAIDVRGRGRSRGGSAGANGVDLDVLAAAHYARERDAPDVTVIGASFGGWASARAAIAAPAVIDRLILLAASPVDEPERLTVPTLFIVARNDTTGSGTPRLTAIRAQYERAPGAVNLVVLDGAAHAQFLFDTDQADRLWAEIIQFLPKP